jgi:hypothetical protein
MNLVPGAVYGHGRSHVCQRSDAGAVSSSSKNEIATRAINKNCDHVAAMPALAAASARAN